MVGFGWILCEHYLDAYKPIKVSGLCYKFCRTSPTKIASFTWTITMPQVIWCCTAESLCQLSFGLGDN